LNNLAQLSYLDVGPKLAREFLNKSGIHLVIERHLPRTHLDGAATKLPDGSPLVALTLRHDRLDNFWFTLFHELAHVGLHLDQDGYEVFYDDLADTGHDKCEDEAAYRQGDPFVDGDFKLDDAANERREDAIVRMLKEGAPVAVIVLGGGHDLGNNVPNDWQYLRVMVEAYRAADE
jgi:HTH-type transcriptional regulator/antitoxin HigA